MITMFIRTVDQFSGDWYKDLGRCHRGYVVDILDGIRTGGREVEAATDMKTVHVDMSFAEGQTYTARERGDGRRDKALRRCKLFRIDLDALPAETLAIIEDTSQPSTLSASALDHLRASRVMNPKHVDPVGEAANLFEVG